MTDVPEQQFHWMEQYKRTQRWHRKVQELNRRRKRSPATLEDEVLDILAGEKGGSPAISDEELDILFAFFMNCYHMYDWLKHSGSLTPADLKSFFRQNEYMKICHDICNGAKHMQLQHPLNKGGFRLGREYDPDAVRQPRIRLILVDDKFYDLFGLADLCIHGLDEFLTNHGLISATR